MSVFFHRHGDPKVEAVLLVDKVLDRDEVSGLHVAAVRYLEGVVRWDDPRLSDPVLLEALRFKGYWKFIP